MRYTPGIYSVMNFDSGTARSITIDNQNFNMPRDSRQTIIVRNVMYHVPDTYIEIVKIGNIVNDTIGGGLMVVGNTTNGN